MTSLSSRMLVWIALSLMLWRPALAQDAIALESVHIDLWPEFDQPSTLVILDAELEARVALPASVTIRIPAAAGQPFAVATRAADGGLLNAPYTTAAAGDYVAVTLTADTRQFRVEYYDPALSIRGGARTYRFRWPADYAAKEVVVRVQQPTSASNLQFEPALSAAGTADFGLSYYTASLGPAAAGQVISLDVAYSRTTSVLSADALGLNTQPGSTTSAPASIPASSPVLIAVVAGGAALAIGGVVWFSISSGWWRGRAGARRRGRPRSAPEKRRRHRPVSSAAAPAAPRPTTAGAAGFCTQCGKPTQPGDAFCRNCGAQLRRPEAG